MKLDQKFEPDFVPTGTMTEREKELLHPKEYWDLDIAKKMNSRAEGEPRTGGTPGPAVVAPDGMSPALFLAYQKAAVLVFGAIHQYPGVLELVLDELLGRWRHYHDSWDDEIAQLVQVTLPKLANAEAAAIQYDFSVAGVNKKPLPADWDLGDACQKLCRATHPVGQLQEDPTRFYCWYAVVGGESCVLLPRLDVSGRVAVGPELERYADVLLGVSAAEYEHNCGGAGAASRRVKGQKVGNGKTATRTSSESTSTGTEVGTTPDSVEAINKVIAEEKEKMAQKPAVPVCAGVVASGNGDKGAEVYYVNKDNRIARGWGWMFLLFLALFSALGGFLSWLVLMGGKGED